MARTLRQCPDNPAVLILLPPSEGKTSPQTGAPCDLTTLSFSEHLHAARRKQWQAQPAAVKRAPAAAAHEVYSGVLYAALNYSTLTAAAQRRANASIVIISALFGAVRPTDAIPAYKATMSNTVWRAPVAAALAQEAGTGLVVDCRSSTYAGVFTPTAQSTVALRVFKQTGRSRTAITHMSKHYRGLAARHLCSTRRTARSPIDVAQMLSQQWTCELHEPAGSSPWLLDIIVTT